MQQSEAVRVEVVVGLQNESRPIPLTMHILVPRPVGELLGEITRRNYLNVSGYTVTRVYLGCSCLRARVWLEAQGNWLERKCCQSGSQG